MLQKLGSIYSDRLHDHAKAMSAWQRVLAIQPGHAKALRVLRDSHVAIGDYDGLTALYAQNGDWEGLVEVLSGAADKAGDAQLKVDLSFRCATVFVEKLNAPDRAFRSYERVLSVRPDDARAASALVPLYEKDEKWGRLPALYEILLGHAAAVEDQLALIDKLVAGHGARAPGPGVVFRVGAPGVRARAGAGWGSRGVREGGARGGAVGRVRRDGERTARGARGLRALAGRGTERPGKKKKKRDRESDSGGRREEVRVLRAKLAEVYAREMGRVDEAVQTYRSLVEEDDGDELAIQTLDRILREANRRDDLRWLFELRVERSNTAAKLDLMSEWAMLEEEAFGSPERAVEIYRRMLQAVPHHGAALRALARLLRAQGDAAGAAEVIALDRDQREGAERAAREIELAKLYVDPLKRYAEALAACERALELLPNDAVSSRSSSSSSPCRRRALVRRRSSNAATRSSATRGDRPKCSRSSSRRPPRATIAWRSTAGSPKSTSAASTTRILRSTSSRVPRASSPPSCRSGIASPRSPRRRGTPKLSSTPSLRWSLTMGRPGFPSTSSSISPSAQRRSSTRSSATRIARARTWSACSRGSPATSERFNASSRS